MSTLMDSQDLRGALRNLTLIVLVRSLGRVPTKVDIPKFFRSDVMSEVRSFATALASFSGIEGSFLLNAVDELLEADEEYLQVENINLLMSLFCGSPVPRFAFVEAECVESVALFRPFLHTAKNLLEAAIRLRMEVGPSTPPNPFWDAFLRFLYNIGGKDSVAAGVAVVTLMDIASGMLVANSDAHTRTNDPGLLASILRVVEELRSLETSTLILVPRFYEKEG